MGTGRGRACLKAPAPDHPARVTNISRWQVSRLSKRCFCTRSAPLPDPMGQWFQSASCCDHGRGGGCGLWRFVHHRIPFSPALESRHQRIASAPLHRWSQAESCRFRFRVYSPQTERLCASSVWKFAEQKGNGLLFPRPRAGSVVRACYSAATDACIMVWSSSSQAMIASAPPNDWIRGRSCFS